MTRAATGTTRKLPSGRYQARLTYPDGMRRSAPQTFVTKRDASAWIAQQVADVSRGVWKADRHDGSMARSFEDYALAWLPKRRVRGAPLAYRTLVSYQDVIDRFLLPTFGARPLHAITREEVERWYDKVAPGRPTTRARAYSVLRTIMNSAVDEGLIDASPVRVRGGGVATRRHQPRPLELDELAVITEHMPPRFRSLVQMAFWSGLRWGELSELRRSDIDMRRSTVHVRRAVVFTKAGPLVKPPKSAAGTRDVILPEPVMPWLRALLANPEWVGKEADALLWPSPSDQKRQMRLTTVGDAFHPAREAAGRPDFHWHDFRHTAGTMLAQAGATTAELMAHLGHSTVNASMIYQHAAGRRMTDLASRLAAMAEGYVQGAADASRSEAVGSSR